MRVLLVDEQPHPGGSLHWQHAQRPQARQRLEELLDRAGSLPNLELRCGTQAAGWYADNWVALVDDRHLTKVRAKASLVATGCVEQPAIFGNNDLPGVMLGSAAQRLLHLYGVVPGKRCVILGANSDAYALTLDLRQAGVEIVSLLDLRVKGEPSELGRAVAVACLPNPCGGPSARPFPDARGPALPERS